MRNINCEKWKKQVHQCRNVMRFWTMLGFKQEALTMELGDDWSQCKISLLEQKEVIEPELLEQIAKVLKAPAEATKNFNEEAAVNYIANTFNGNSVNYMNFNPIDKVVELYERIIIKEKGEKIAPIGKDPYRQKIIH